MPRPKSKAGYKTKRKYSCPYCDEKMIRGDLVEHIQDEHEMMIPQGYSAARVVYDHINGKNYGTCFICGDKVYEWDDKLWRYKNLCNKKSCRDAVHKKALNNNLNNPEKQKLMLQNRKISGEYIFSDGQKRSYTGSYEKKTLQFMDKAMNISADDIVTPGPTFDYWYKGEKHTWITDIFYIPAMLVIDVKDGGDNPNNRPMESYREKQIEKEKAIQRDGKYNYLRLTNNDFGQLLSAIADIRYGDIVEDLKKGIYINEGAMPPAYHSQDYIIPCGMQGMNLDDTDGFVFGNTMLDKAIKFDKYGRMIIDKPDVLMEGKITNKSKHMNPDGKMDVGNKRFRKIKFNAPAQMGSKKTFEKAKKKIEDGKARNLQEALLDELLDKPYLGVSDLYYNENTVLDTDGIIRQKEKNPLKAMTEEFICTAGRHLSIMRDREGFYLTTTDKDYLITSEYYDNKEDIPVDIIELMDSLYEKNKRGGLSSNDWL